MIGYITVGTNNLERAAKFYDKLFAELGATRFIDMKQFVAWGTGPDKPKFSVTLPNDGKEATVGNGIMIALAADSTEQVDALYKKAMDLGATDEGLPGPRSAIPGFYAGYFRDLDGNKLNVFYMDSPAAE